MNWMEIFKTLNNFWRGIPVMGYCYKISQTSWLKQQKCISHSFGEHQSQMKGWRMSGPSDRCKGRLPEFLTWLLHSRQHMAILAVCLHSMSFLHTPLSGSLSVRTPAMSIKASVVNFRHHPDGFIWTWLLTSLRLLSQNEVTFWVRY